MEMRRRILQVLIAAILSLTVAPALLCQVNQDPITIYTRQADDFYRNGRLEQALAEYEKVLKLDPGNPYALHQTNIIRQKLGLDTPSEQPQTPAAASAEAKKYPPLPPRDYSRILPRVGAAYKDDGNRFTIQPPMGWWTDKYNPHFAVKFTDPGYEAFLFINVIELEGPVVMDSGFRKFISEKSMQVEGSLMGYRSVYQNTMLFKGKPALEVRATYVAGINLVRLTTFYIPSGNRVFMVTTVCNDDLYDVWRPVFAASVDTLKITGL